MNLSEIAFQLGKTGICVVPNFLSEVMLTNMQLDLAQLLNFGQMSRAGTGQGQKHQVRDDLRKDQVFWLDRPTATSVQRLLWGQLDLLLTAFNQSLFIGLQNFQGHYASYPKMGFYHRHLDALAQKNDRKISLILYLNPDWQIADGGCLRIHTQESYLDIAPVGGTLVCFLSEEFEHEVRTSHARRDSFTGWFRVSKSDV